MAGVLFFLVIVIALMFAAAVIMGIIDGRKKSDNSSKKELKALLYHRTQRLQIAEAALRQIASNDSGIPVLDAQNALNKINQLELKELESNQ